MTAQRQHYIREIEMSKKESYWTIESSETMTIHTRKTDKGILLVMDTKVECFTVDEDGKVVIHLKRRTASDLSNILTKTLIEGNPKED
jgi:hypothetical protein